MASPCTVQAVQEFLMGRGGRVQQMELIDHFATMWGGASDPLKEEEALKRVVDKLGVVEVESGVKYVRLNVVSSARSVTRVDGDGHEHVTECNGDVRETANDNNLVSGNPDNKQRTGEC